jgi:putative zinc finger protein
MRSTSTATWRRRPNERPPVESGFAAGRGTAMTTECKTFDEKLLDYLYEELDEAERTALRSHVEGCARCKAEVESFGRVRSAVKSVALAEPPPAVSAKLMYQASQRARRAGLRGVIVPLFQKMARHPVYAMAASFLVVGGVASVLWTSQDHRAMMQEAPVPTKAPEAAKPSEPTAGELAKAAPAAAAPVTTPSTESAFLDGHAKGEKQDQVAADEASFARARREVTTKEREAKPGLVWHASKGTSDKEVHVVPERGSGYAGAASGPAARPAGAVSADRPADERSGAAFPSANAPANDALGQMARPKLPAASVAAAPPPPKTAPALKPSPASKSAKQQLSLDDLDQQDGRQAMDNNMREIRRGEIDGKIGRAAPAKTLPPPSAPLQQVAAPNSASRDDQQPVEIEEVLRRFDQQTASNRCVEADQTYRQILEHHPESLTPQHRFEHARCRRALGQYREARSEFERLLSEAPSLRNKIQGELRGLAVEEQAHHPATEAPMAAPARNEKKAAQRKAKASDTNAADSAY